MPMWFEDRIELATRRKSLGLSQATLGALAGISRSVVRDVERGRIKLHGERAQRLWKAICGEMHRQEQGLSTIAEAFSPAEPQQFPNPFHNRTSFPGDEMKIAFSEFCDLASEFLQQRRELVDLRARLAEIAERVDSLHAETQAATADEGTRILEENAAHEGATK